MSIENAANTVAVARQAANAADATVEDAQDTASHLRSRVGALEAERAKIIAASRAGNADPALALRLGVIDADLNDLRPLLTDADADVTAAKAAATSAAQAVVNAEQHLAIARDADLEAKLVEHTEKLAGLLGSTVAELRVIWMRRGARPTWAPADELVRELERLRLIGKQIRAVA